MNTKFSTLASDFMCKISSIVDKVADLEKRQDKIESRIDTVANEMHVEIATVREEIHEQSRRMHKIMNIVMMGVPESEEGIKAAHSIMKIIVPSWCDEIPDIRIGDPNRPNQSIPRPLRITCRSAQGKISALKNCTLLKGLDQYKTISVRKDLTKQQQAEWKAQAVERQSRRATRSQSSSKRKHSDTGSSPSSKEIRMDTGNSDHGE